MYAPAPAQFFEGPAPVYAPAPVAAAPAVPVAAPVPAPVYAHGPAPVFAPAPAPVYAPAPVFADQPLPIARVPASPVFAGSPDAVPVQFMHAAPGEMMVKQYVPVRITRPLLKVVRPVVRDYIIGKKAKN